MCLVCQIDTIAGGQFPCYSIYGLEALTHTQHWKMFRIVVYFTDTRTHTFYIHLEVRKKEERDKRKREGEGRGRESVRWKRGEVSQYVRMYKHGPFLCVQLYSSFYFHSAIALPPHCAEGVQ